MNGNNNGPQAPKGARLAFGIIMILVYIGVGLLFIFKIFDVIDPVVSYVVGGLLILYGIFRGYRLYLGSN
ncbi:MAG: hypothetical protein HDS79_07635 [Bacteroidales bacterium]|nr:hypothetical protein [Bacteroidales bacterium]MDE7465444.1 hypothetical protein [Muribaculaceae bacterium]